MYKKDNDQDETEVWRPSTEVDEDLNGVKMGERNYAEQPLLSQYKPHGHGCNSTINGNDKKQVKEDDTSIHITDKETTGTTGSPTEKTAGSKYTTYSKDRNRFRYEVCFDNIIGEEEEYTVTISTELNGRTVTQMVEKFPMGRPDT